MKLFSKLKDYNALLEEILDRKTFSSVAKSMLLSMIYKIEISYSDYSRVKVDAVSKDRFLKNILDIVKKYCDNIKIVEPESIQAELLIKHKVDALTNSKERSILVYPTEIAMFYAISDIEPKFFYIKDEFIFKSVMQKVLVDGYKQNNMEILRNFSGWSWDINSKNKQNYICNLIYQNIMMLKSEDFLYDWLQDDMVKRDYLQELKKSMKNISGNDNYYLSLCKLLYLISNKKDKVKITEILEEKKKQYEKFENESEKIKKENIREINKLKSYCAILENDKSEYEQTIELQKYFLGIIKKKIEKADTKEELMELFYEIRYYQYTVLFNGMLVKQNDDLKEALDIVQKMLITKSCKIGIIKIISMDIECNFNIIKNILDTKILNLENIKIDIELDGENIIVKVYDKEIFEKKFEEKFNGNKKDIVLRRKKMVKLFN